MTLVGERRVGNQGLRDRREEGERGEGLESSVEGEGGGGGELQLRSGGEGNGSGHCRSLVVW